MNYTTELKDWGDSGEEYPDNYSYQKDERPIDIWDNFFADNVIEDLKYLIGVTNNNLLQREGGSLQSDLDVGSYTLSGDAGNLGFDGDTISVDSSISVTGTTNLGGAVDIGGPVGITGNLSVTGGSLDLGSGALTSIDWKNSDGGEGSGLDADTLRGRDPNEMRGFQYVQDLTPGDEEIGATWFKPSNGLLVTSGDRGPEPQPSILYDETDEFNDAGYSVEHEEPEARTETTTNGQLKLINEVEIADFEDGSIDPHNGIWSWTSGSDTGNLSVQSVAVLAGTQSLEFEADGELTEVFLEREHPTIDNFNFKFQISNDTGSIDDEVSVQFHDQDQNTFAKIEFYDGAGNVEFYDTYGNSTELFESWNTATVFDCKLNFDFPNQEFELLINGTSYGVYDAPGMVGFERFGFINQTSGSNDPRSIYVDDLREDPREFGNVLVHCPDPDRSIRDWDILKYEYNLDGENITIDVEDEDGNVLIENVDDFGDLSVEVPGETNPKLRVHFSREDTDNHPMMQSVYRQYTMPPGGLEHHDHDGEVLNPEFVNASEIDSTDITSEMLATDIFESNNSEVDDRLRIPVYNLVEDLPEADPGSVAYVHETRSLHVYE